MLTEWPQKNGDGGSRGCRPAVRLDDIRPWARAELAQSRRRRCRIATAWVAAGLMLMAALAVLIFLPSR